MKSVWRGGRGQISLFFSVLPLTDWVALDTSQNCREHQDKIGMRMLTQLWILWPEKMFAKILGRGKGGIVGDKAWQRDKGELDVGGHIYVAWRKINPNWVWLPHSTQLWTLIRYTVLSMMVWGVKHSLARECGLDFRRVSDEGIQLCTTQAGYLPSLSICRAYLWVQVATSHTCIWIWLCGEEGMNGSF